jgi:hypothetical protein
LAQQAVGIARQVGADSEGSATRYKSKPFGTKIVNTITSSLLESLNAATDGSEWDGPNTAVQAGHFMLVAGHNGCISTVEDTRRDALRVALRRFSLESWSHGVEMVAELKRRRTHSKVLTLVNDWQYVRNRDHPDASLLRSAFYAQQTTVFNPYMHCMKANGLDVKDILPIAKWYPYVSESWLRRRIERRLKRMLTAPLLANELYVERSGDNGADLYFDDFGRACRLLVCGRADCAGEVMELVKLLHECGYRRLINIIPSECSVPVAEGTRRAIKLFRLHDFSAINIALPCLTNSDTNTNSSRIELLRINGEMIDGMSSLVDTCEHRWQLTIAT